MAQAFQWDCPYCGHHTTITEPNHSYAVSRISTANSKHREVLLAHAAIACPNPECGELWLRVSLNTQKWIHGSLLAGEKLLEWNLMPKSRARPQPDYIPSEIRANYEEACLILNDSPKASATMSRRCLQGIVRDYWDIPENKRGNLGAELKSIRDDVDASTWKAITTIREIGDIGAHMEKDVNYVVDVEPAEASLLIDLIEMLIANWYVARHDRERRDKQVIEVAQKKLSEKRQAKADAKSSPSSSSDGESD